MARHLLLRVPFSAADRPPSCSRRMRREGLRPTSPNCQGCCGSLDGGILYRTVFGRRRHHHATTDSARPVFCGHGRISSHRLHSHAEADKKAASVKPWDGRSVCRPQHLEFLASRSLRANPHLQQHSHIRGAPKEIASCIAITRRASNAKRP